MMTLYQEILDVASKWAVPHPWRIGKESMLHYAIMSGDKRFIGLAIRYARAPAIYDVITYGGPIWLLDWAFLHGDVDKTDGDIYHEAVDHEKRVEYVNWLYRHGVPFPPDILYTGAFSDISTLYKWFAERGAFLCHK